MKNFIRKFVLFGAIIFFAQNICLGSFGDQSPRAYSTESEETNKFYVEKDQILLGKNGMFVDLFGELFSIEYIGYNEQGYYVAPLYWICKEGHYQPLYTWPRCRKCGSPPAGS